MDLADHLATRVERVPIGRFPTPVRRIPELEEAIGVKGLWVKGDDLSHPGYGGNKIRKLEYVFGAARLAGAEALATIGGIGSNHVLATAYHGRNAGFKVKAALFIQPVDEHVLTNLRALSGLDVDVALYSRAALPVAILSSRLNALGDCFWVPGGGSSPMGTLGHVDAGLELARQIEGGELEEPELVYCALGTGGTAIGLAIGFSLAGLETRVVAVRVVDRVVANRSAHAVLAARTASLIKRLPKGAARKALGRVLALEIDHKEFGGEYGRPTGSASDAVEIAGRAGVELETTYTGKAMASLVKRGRRGELRDRRVLFWNTHNSADLSGMAGAARPERLPEELGRLLASHAD